MALLQDFLAAGQDARLAREHNGHAVDKAAGEAASANEEDQDEQNESTGVHSKDQRADIGECHVRKATGWSRGLRLSGRLG